MSGHVEVEQAAAVVADHEEDVGHSSELWPTLGAKGDLTRDMLAEEQVLDDEAPTAEEGSDEGGLYEPDEFEHRGRIANQPSADRCAAFCRPTAYCCTYRLRNRGFRSSSGRPERRPALTSDRVVGGPDLGLWVDIFCAFRTVLLHSSSPIVAA